MIADRRRLPPRSSASVEKSLDAARKSVPIAYGTTIRMKMDEVAAAVEVVARTGDGEAVRVFDLGPWRETMSGSPGGRRAGRTCEGD